MQSSSLNNESKLFELLATTDRCSLNVQLSQLLSEGAETAVSENWIEVLLSWHMAGVRMDHSLVERFLSVLTVEQISALDGTLYDRFLPAIANDMFGIEAF